MAFDVTVADPDQPEIAALLDRHFQTMRAQSPPESCHVLPTDALKTPDVTVFAVHDAGSLLAVGALKLAPDYGELKSMHTAIHARGRGAGRALMDALMAYAAEQGVARLNLETGSGDEHAAARRLYERAGFSQCPPFGSYTNDPLSCFMTRAF